MTQDGEEEAGPNDDDNDDSEDVDFEREEEDDTNTVENEDVQGQPSETTKGQQHHLPPIKAVHYPTTTEGEAEEVESQMIKTP